MTISSLRIHAPQARITALHWNSSASSPLCAFTPVTRPFSVTISSVIVSVRISPPNSRSFWDVISTNILPEPRPGPPYWGPNGPSSSSNTYRPTEYLSISSLGAMEQNQSKNCPVPFIMEAASFRSSRQKVSSMRLRIYSAVVSGRFRSFCHWLPKVRMVDAMTIPPPSRLSFSSTTTRLPSVAARQPAMSPLPPPPMTTRSHCFFIIINYLPFVTFNSTYFTTAVSLKQLAVSVLCYHFLYILPFRRIG